MNAPSEGFATDLRRVHRFIHREARLLDGRCFEEWMELFVPEGYYWAPARPDQADPWTEVSLIFDDRQLMTSRITRLRHPKIHAQIPPSRAVRQVSNVEIEDIDPTSGEITVSSVLFMFEHRPTLPEPIQRVFAGHCHHRLRLVRTDYAIVWKKVVLANCDAALDSLFVYF